MCRLLINTALIENRIYIKLISGETTLSYYFFFIKAVNFHNRVNVII